MRKKAEGHTILQKKRVLAVIPMAVLSAAILIGCGKSAESDEGLLTRLIRSTYNENGGISRRTEYEYDGMGTG